MGFFTNAHNHYAVTLERSRGFSEDGWGQQYWTLPGIQMPGHVHPILIQKVSPGNLSGLYAVTVPLRQGCIDESDDEWSHSVWACLKGAGSSSVRQTGELYSVCR